MDCLMIVTFGIDVSFSYFRAHPEEVCWQREGSPISSIEEAVETFSNLQASQISLPKTKDHGSAIFKRGKAKGYLC